MKKTMMICCAVAAAISAMADYSLVDGFESYTAGSFSGGSTASAYNGSGPWYTSNQGNTSLVAIEGSGDQYLSFGWNGGGDRNPNRAVTTIADGEVGTYYFQFNTSDATQNDFSLGFSDVAAGSTGFADFNTFEAQIGITYSAATGIRVGARNGGSFANDLATGLSANTWYDLWVVVDNDADTYDVYFGQTGNANTLGSLIADDYSFRNAGSGNVGDIVTFLGIENDSGDDRHIHVDNLYYNSVAVPEPATMGLFALSGGALFLVRRRLRI